MQVRIRYTIPTDEYLGGWIVFHRWLPSGVADAVVRERDGFATRLWCGLEDTASLAPVEDADVSRTVNLGVRKLNAEVTIQGVQPALASFIYDERARPQGVHHGLSPDDPSYTDLNEEYKELGLATHRHLLETLNRLVQFVRNEKGQYWLTEVPFDRDYVSSPNVGFRAEATLDGTEWFRWCPPVRDVLAASGADVPRLIGDKDWARLREFIAEDRRSTLVWELMANADALAAEGHRRSALIEAVAALEVGISRFAERAPASTTSRTRLDLQSLGSQVSHLGLSGTVRYLLPLVFTEEQVSTELLIGLQDAVDQRGNVVHQGQRDVDAARLFSLLRTVRAFLERLQDLSESVIGDPS